MNMQGVITLVTLSFAASVLAVFTCLSPTDSLHHNQRDSLRSVCLVDASRDDDRLKLLSENSSRSGSGDQQVVSVQRSDQTSLAARNMARRGGHGPNPRPLPAALLFSSSGTDAPFATQAHDRGLSLFVPNLVILFLHLLI